MRSRPWIACVLFAAASPGCSTTGAPARSELAASTSPIVDAFVAEYAVLRGEPDLATVRSLVRLVSSRRLFTRVERRVMAGWNRSPDRRAAWLQRLKQQELAVERLETLAKQRLLAGEEAQQLARAKRTVIDMRRREAAWQQVYREVEPRDYPFVLGGKQALELRVIDGCTSASRMFSVLANAVGIETRLVCCSDLAGLRRVVRPGLEPTREVVNGHKMALVRIHGRWYLVNENYYAPERGRAYEIFTELDGERVGPDMLLGRVLRLPSMQVADGRRSPELLVTNVGPPAVVDMGEKTLDGNLNLAVSGDPNNPMCTNPALGELLRVASAASKK